jgi:prepilin signal peptidase PulO-like enzyme (type II secretory pathway)
MPLRLSALFVLAVSIPIAVVDARSQRIPDVLTLGGSGGLVLLFAIVEPRYLPWLVVQGLFGLGVFVLLHFLSGRRVGLGDAKYSAFIAGGLGVLGWCIAVATGSATALLVAAVGVGTRRLRLDSRIALGPFLATGVLMTTVVIVLRPSWFAFPW